MGQFVGHCLGIGGSRRSDREGVMRAVVLWAGVRRARRLLLLTGCLILGVLGLGTVEARAATPASLVGETFTSQTVSGSTLTGACPGAPNNAGSFVSP